MSSVEWFVCVDELSVTGGYGSDANDDDDGELLTTFHSAMTRLV